MKDKTFEKVWENVIKVQAQEILKEDRILNRKGEVCFDKGKMLKMNMIIFEDIQSLLT